MKKFVIVTVSMMLAVLSGCAPYYGSAKNYESGNWWMFADQDSASEYKSQQLAFKKMEANDVKPNAVQGYEGIVANESGSKITVRIVGPEKRSFFLEPRRVEKAKLIPGKYVAYVYRGSQLAGSDPFVVAPRENRYKGHDVAWFVAYNP